MQTLLNNIRLIFILRFIFICLLLWLKFVEWRWWWGGGATWVRRDESVSPHPFCCSGCSVGGRGEKGCLILFSPSTLSSSSSLKHVDCLYRRAPMGWLLCFYHSKCHSFIFGGRKREVWLLFLLPPPPCLSAGRQIVASPPQVDCCVPRSVGSSCTYSLTIQNGLWPVAMTGNESRRCKAHLPPPGTRER